MKILFLIFFLTILQNLKSQGFNSVYMESDSIDSNNEIYKLGTAFIFDYEIILNGIKMKLQKNENLDLYNIDFVLKEIGDTAIKINEIIMFVDSNSNENIVFSKQTCIAYFDSPNYFSCSKTGLIENENNVWLHPIRYGFFRCLELCPYPYIKRPIVFGSEIVDSNWIGTRWGNDLWGKLDSKLLLTFYYKVSNREIIKTRIGDINCYKIESYASSSFGQTKLTSYYSDIYGFVKLEYEITTELKVIFTLAGILKNKTSIDFKSYFK